MLRQNSRHWVFTLEQLDSALVIHPKKMAKQNYLAISKMHSRSMFRAFNFDRGVTTGREKATSAMLVAVVKSGTVRGHLRKNVIRNDARS